MQYFEIFLKFLNNSKLILINLKLLIDIFKKNMINYINKKYLLFNFLIVIIDYNVQNVICCRLTIC